MLRYHHAMNTPKRPIGQRGQGRKPLQEGVETVTFTLRMTPEQKAKVIALGGGKWVRDRIDRAKR